MCWDDSMHLQLNQKKSHWTEQILTRLRPPLSREDSIVEDWVQVSFSHSWVLWGWTYRESTLWFSRLNFHSHIVLGTAAMDLLFRSSLVLWKEFFKVRLESSLTRTVFSSPSPAPNESPDLPTVDQAQWAISAVCAEDEGEVLYRLMENEAAWAFWNWLSASWCWCNLKTFLSFRQENKEDSPC